MEKTALSIADLEARLAHLRQSAHEPLDKVQLGFMEGLLKRTAGKTANVQDIILEKAAATLERYENRHRDETVAITVMAATDQPLNDPVAKPLTNPLTMLLAQLEQQARQASIEPAQASLQELIDHMEQAIVRPASPRPAPAPAPAKRTRRRKTSAPATPAGPELKATRKARKLMAIDKARRLVDDMNTLQPENPGPLNPQMLATRAITLMRDLSPAYLNRFLTLMDTLFWLEQAGEAQDMKKSRQP